MKTCRICNNCKYQSTEYSSGPTCLKAPIIKIDEIKGNIVKKRVKCKDRNKNFKCLWFKKLEKKRYPINSMVTVRFTAESGNVFTCTSKIMSQRDNYYMVLPSELGVSQRIEKLYHTMKLEMPHYLINLMVWVPEEDIS